MINTVIEFIGHDMDMSDAVLFDVEDVVKIGTEEGDESGSNNAKDGNNGKSQVRYINDTLPLGIWMHMSPLPRL